MKEQTHATLEGQVAQCDFDEDGFYTVMLVVDGEEEYVIEPGREGSRLEEFLDHWVTIRGEVRRKDDDRFYLKVHFFQLEDDSARSDEDW